jgi:hypothetical protein
MRCGRWYSCDALLEWLAQDLEDMAAALGEFIQEQHAVVGPRHLARPRHVAPTDQPHIGAGVMRGAARPGHDQHRVGAGEASDAMDARGLNGFGVIDGRMVVSRRASLDLPAPGGRGGADYD